LSSGIGRLEHTLAVIFIERDYFVHRFFGGIASPLGLLDLLRITPLLDNKIEYVEHVEMIVVTLSRAFWGVFKSVLFCRSLTQLEIVFIFPFPALVGSLHPAKPLKPWSRACMDISRLSQCKVVEVEEIHVDLQVTLIAKRLQIFKTSPDAKV